MRVFLALCSLFIAGPVFAQNVPQGIAFAMTNDGTWLCRHENLDEAMACARELCAEQAPGQTCVRTAWCYPGGWSGVMVIWLPEERVRKAVCGAPSQAGLMNAMRAFCIGTERASICDLVTVVDPNGNERSVEAVIFAGGAAPTDATVEGEPSEEPVTETIAQ